MNQTAERVLFDVRELSKHIYEFVGSSPNECCDICFRKELWYTIHSKQEEQEEPIDQDEVDDYFKVQKIMDYNLRFNGRRPVFKSLLGK